MKKVYLTLLAFITVLLVGSLCSCELPFGIGGPKYTYTDLGDSYELTDLGDSEETEIKIPAEYKGKPVTSIGQGAFYRREYIISNGEIKEIPQITSITLPDSITTIGQEAFSNSSQLTSLTIPASVTSIGDGAFFNCSSLTELVIPDGITEIKSYTFAGCLSLKTVTIPNTVTSIGNNAFQNCAALTSFTFDENITSVGDYAFSGCTGLTELTIPDTVTTLGERVFEYTSEEFTVSVCYDAEPLEGWDEKWYSGIKGKALNTSTVYFQNVVTPNIEKAEELKARIESLKASYQAVEAERAEHYKQNQNPYVYENQSLYKAYRDKQNEYQAQKRNLSEAWGKLEDELDALKITNQIN